MSCSSVSLSKDVANMFADLPQPTNSCLASYIWIGSDCRHCRYKTRTLEFVPKTLDELPWWDMSDEMDAFLEPIAFFRDPFFPTGHNFLVLCETYTLDRKITEQNNRHKCKETMAKAQDDKPTFYITQKYILLDKDGLFPLGQSLISQNQTRIKVNNILSNDNTIHRFTINGDINETARMTTKSSSTRQAASNITEYSNDTIGFDNYCSIGHDKSCGRNIAEAHYKACLFAGVKVASLASENLFQWKFKIGPCEGIEAGDHLWMARFILHRVAEDFGVVVSFDPSLLPGVNNMIFDTRCFKSNYFLSTKSMRSNVQNMIESLDKINQVFRLENQCENVNRPISLAKNIIFIHHHHQEGDSERQSMSRCDKLFRICMDNQATSSTLPDLSSATIPETSNSSTTPSPNEPPISSSPPLVAPYPADLNCLTANKSQQRSSNKYDAPNGDICLSSTKEGFIEVNNTLSSCDPYLITNKLVSTLLLNDL